MGSRSTNLLRHCSHESNPNSTIKAMVSTTNAWMRNLFFLVAIYSIPFLIPRFINHKAIISRFYSKQFWCLWWWNPYPYPYSRWIIYMPDPKKWPSLVGATLDLLAIWDLFLSAAVGESRESASILEMPTISCHWKKPDIHTAKLAKLR